MKKALICGVSGQDGGYLSKLLLEKGYEVYGGSRDASSNSFDNLRKLGLKDKVNLVSINICDFRSTLQTIIKIKPDEIYNLSGQSSVGLSFDQPVETFESISIGTLNLLEAIRFSNLPVRLYNSGSSECFGESGNLPADENTSFKPRSPYAIAKATSHWQVANYREAYHIYSCTGILFNHESPMRPHRFVTKKIVSTACRIYKGSDEKLQLGNINIQRDWGWAPDYVEAMWLMLQQEIPDDFVIATGITHSLKYYIQLVFTELNLDWEKQVVLDNSLLRPTDLVYGRANPSKAAAVLGWKAKHTLEDIVRSMVAYELENSES
ncbi:MAG: GDP-mannose 4,6-dehydratase [Chitinophagaceae bacterium]|nr:GDP-mannose 4,6-dehydratase [Chitinophagaceae bacterium]MDP1762771.1 GDP-mannose 4,6-dehydratase [Sediminibacterium sp.]MDP1812799.1 GDP-mannose 4,6-dehydratase [Sediminibacterium sp.]MDP3126937.1 GDP-mannose 4,6-dehydratase [Sediminibacterium sp.]